jgi:ATP-dependent RNA helicase RhlE
MSFSSLGLGPKILSTLEKLKYSVATPIQVAAIPPILAGQDVLGCAQTGTGKTAAFSLPILQKLFLTQTGDEAEMAAAPVENPRSGKPRGRDRSTHAISVLVLTPTRELANQVAKSFATYGKMLGVRQAVVYGGVSQNPQVKVLQAGVDVVVATPGRLLDLMGQGAADLSKLKVLVLDEADQMLDMGFIQPLKRIVARIPARRQTLMFSATMPPEIQRLAEQWLHDPVTVHANVVARPPDKIKQSVAFVEHAKKAEALIEYLQQTAGIRHIVFCRTKRGADKLAKLLERARISAAAIHGNKSQNARERALSSFSSETPPILVATDVAARGLHMPGVSHVINYDLPNTPETYVHRIGRTARAGAAGESISFCSSDEREYLRDIERLIGYSIPVQSLAGFSSPSPTKSRQPVQEAQPPTRAKATGSGTAKQGSTRPNAGHSKSASPIFEEKKSVRQKAWERQTATRTAAARKAAAVQAIRSTTERPVAERPSTERPSTAKQMRAASGSYSGTNAASRPARPVTAQPSQPRSPRSEFSRTESRYRDEARPPRTEPRRPSPAREDRFRSEERPRSAKPTPPGREERPRSEAPRSSAPRSHASRSEAPRSDSRRPEGTRSDYGRSSSGPPRSSRSTTDRTESNDRPNRNFAATDRPRANRPNPDRPSPARSSERPRADRPNDRPRSDRPRESGPAGERDEARPTAARRSVAKRPIRKGSI